MKYSVCTTTPEVEARIPVALLGGSFPDRLEKAALFGYDGVELMAVEPSRLDVPALRDAVLSRGLEVSAVATGAIAGTRGLTLLGADDAVRSLARGVLSELVRLAGALGAPVITIGSFRGRAAAVGGRDAARMILGHALAEAAAEASTVGVHLALEPINRYETDFLQNMAETLEFIESVGSPNLGILLDTFHINIEESSRTECLRSAFLKGILRHVHIADSNRLPPGKGHIDFRNMLGVLRDVGYRGYLSAELLGGTDPDAAAKSTIDSMRRFELPL